MDRAIDQFGRAMHQTLDSRSAAREARNSTNTPSATFDRISLAYPDLAMTLTMIHSNPALVTNGNVRVDRKFLTGMRNYVANLSAPIISVHPQMAPGEAGIDTIEVPTDSLGYRIVTLRTNRARTTIPEDQSALRGVVATSSLIYGGGLGAIEEAQRQGKPYILVLEYDMATQIAVTTLSISNPVRRLIRRARTAWHYLRHQVPEMRGAQSIHCNGYPIYDATAGLNKDRLLYLDSRMATNNVIPAGQLEQRLQQFGKRPLRLIFSGRYEPMKGALDAVACAIACLRRGIDIVFDCYGQGSQAQAMRNLAKSNGVAEKVRIHDSIPFPQLVETTRDFDLFICCHRQHDPSCTYLESFGSGLPIVGYANRMWARMCQESGAGLHSPMGKVEQVADSIAALAKDESRLRKLSERARDFALAHTFEKEFARRTDALTRTIATAR